MSALITPLSRSSNWPRNLVPASSAPMSSEYTLRVLSTSGTLPWWMRSARPSAMAVLPTPGSPTKIGLFLRRRHSTCIVRSSSRSRPISGSMRPAAASATRSVVYASSGLFCGAGSASVSSSSESPPRARAGGRMRDLVHAGHDAVRHVLLEVELGDARLLEQVHRERLGLLEDLDQHGGAVDGFLLAAHHVDGGAPQDALDARASAAAAPRRPRAASPPLR